MIGDGPTNDVKEKIRPPLRNINCQIAIICHTQTLFCERFGGSETIIDQNTCHSPY